MHKRKLISNKQSNISQPSFAKSSQSSSIFNSSNRKSFQSQVKTFASNKKSSFLNSSPHQMDVEESESNQIISDSEFDSVSKPKQLFNESGSDTEDISLADEDNSFDAAQPLSTGFHDEAISDEEMASNSVEDIDALKEQTPENDAGVDEITGETSDSSKPLCANYIYIYKDYSSLHI